MSHIAVIAMEMLCSFYVLMILFSVHATHSHKGSTELFCTNDFVNNVRCTWNSSSGGPDVNCWISGVKKGGKPKNNIEQSELIIRRCKLKQHRNSLPGCNFVFENREFYAFEVMPNISMNCNGTLVENLENYKPHNHIKMHPPGVPNVSSNANDTVISWRPGRPVSRFFTSFEFQVQVKQKNQTWREASTLSTQEQELRIPVWQLKGLWQVRVRVKPTNRLSSHWSSWSSATSWVGVTDRADTSDNQEWWLDQMSLVISGLIFSLCLIVVVMLALYKSCKTRGFLKSRPVPNPSKYFCTLHSVQGGNLKKWLNPLSVSESFFTAEPCDHISSVEVCEDWDVTLSTSPSSGFISGPIYFQSYPSACTDTIGIVDNSSSSSNFSNMGYFMSSSSSDLAQADPKPTYLPYQDGFHHPHNSNNLKLKSSPCASHTTCPAYKSLKSEPQSPDSGFGIGKEDEKENETDMNIDGELVLDDNSSHFLILPLHLPFQMRPQFVFPTLSYPPSVTQISNDSQQVAVPVTAAGINSAELVAGAICRSSSVSMEPSKTGYLTLKELQTAFSNKSI
ncbi:interleukin-2 receptor subunit beta [Stegastes partitus]|uniref:Interleukin-2 receptor subunit beta n=1 Tax=Stegastes partitus TaxID=144197 RepID=A0A3B5AJ88_9TELE|nr:PREDICTED: interleukin-2 receptor subunit beta [Stegastes partitus]